MPRAGKGGKVNPTRTDLNTAAPAAGRDFGAKTADQQAMEAIPLENQQTVPTGAAGPSAPGPLPGSLGPLAAPTNRPDEPLTAGTPFGEGPGYEARLVSPHSTYLTPLQKVAQSTQHPRLLEIARRKHG